MSFPHTASGPPEAAVLDDHLLARWLAETAGQVLVQVRAEGADLDAAALKAAGDAASQTYLAAQLLAARPGDAVLSEEAKDVGDRSTASRVWIIDPLDGTREFSEPPREDWAVHVALWEDGDLVAGAVTRPASDLVFATTRPEPPDHPDHPDRTPALPTRPEGPIRLAVSRTRPPAFVSRLAEQIGAELVPMGSAGVKATAILEGVADAYVHAGGQFEWDSAAPVVVARARGLHTSRLDGSPLQYNRADPLLPDLVICRPEFSRELLAAIAITLDEGHIA